MMLCVHGSPLYQWDINRQLLIDSAELGSDFVIHCCYAEDSNAPVVEPKMVEDKVLVNIPNNLLQRHGHLRVYVVTEGDTVYDATFYVMARPKPDDYVYTETEVLSYVSLSKRMDEFEKNGVSEEKLAEAINDYLSEHPITETDPTVPAWAKQSEKPKYTASEVGALSQEELQNGVNLALEQAKESGEFDGADGYTPIKGKDYFDGNDYVLTESDKQEIADMIDIPESGGGEKQWQKIGTFTANDNINQWEIDTDENGNPFACTEFRIWMKICVFKHSSAPSFNHMLCFYGDDGTWKEVFTSALQSGIIPGVSGEDIANVTASFKNPTVMDITTHGGYIIVTSADEGNNNAGHVLIGVKRNRGLQHSAKKFTKIRYKMGYDKNLVMTGSTMEVWGR